jgi:hypothetical protein
MLWDHLGTSADKSLVGGGLWQPNRRLNGSHVFCPTWSIYDLLARPGFPKIIPMRSQAKFRDCLGDGVARRSDEEQLTLQSGMQPISAHVPRVSVLPLRLSRSSYQTHDLGHHPSTLYALPLTRYHLAPPKSAQRSITDVLSCTERVKARISPFAAFAARVMCFRS